MKKVQHCYLHPYVIKEFDEHYDYDIEDIYLTYTNYYLGSRRRRRFTTGYWSYIDMNQVFLVHQRDIPIDDWN